MASSTLQLSIFTSLTSEIFWVAFGAIVTALALVYTIFLAGWHAKRKALKIIKKALYFELLTNIDSLFTGEVERRPLFDAVNSIRKNFIADVKDQATFAQIQRLYSELDYYKTVVDNVYLNPYVENNGNLVTEKQLSTMNKFLEFFGQRSYSGSQPQSLRNDAIKVKEDNIAQWAITLKTKIDKLF